MPDTRPDLVLDSSGVCSACRWAEEKARIDWTARRSEWDIRVAEIKRSQADAAYDVIAAVSGGKDSTYIVLRLFDAGLRVLGVSFEPTWPTPEGQSNLETLSHYCDVIQVRKRRDVYRKLARIGFAELGDHEWPNHAGIWAAPLQEAVRRRIPWVVWGENPVAEYGAPDRRSVRNRYLDQKWVEEFGQRLGLRLSDLETRGFSAGDLTPYQLPDLRRARIKSEFLGYYFKWDTIAQMEMVRSATASVSHSKLLGCATKGDPVLLCSSGFAPRPPYRRAGIWWEFENVDCLLVDWHDYLGYLKFGYTRAQAQLSIEVRHGYKTREEALELVTTIGSVYPASTEKAFLDYLSMSKSEMVAVLDRFTNKSLFTGPSTDPVLKYPPE